MSQAKSGDLIQVHYTGTLDSGEVFDSSYGADPLEFTLGQGMVIPGFEQGIEGMQVGEKKTLVLPPEEAYGPYNEDLKGQVDKSQLPSDIDPQVGAVLEVGSPDGQHMHMVITEVTDEYIVLDGNPPLAGQQLTFEVELVKIC